MTKQINIDEILHNTDYQVVTRMHKEVMDVPDDEIVVEQRIKLREHLKSELKQQLYDLMLEIIGEETLQTIEYNTVYGTPKTGKRKKAGWKVRDRLRQEQRQKLTNLFNITQ